MRGSAPLWIFGLGIVALVALIGGVAWWIRKRRRDAFKVLALELDLRYSQEDLGLPALFGAFKIFGLGRGRRSTLSLTGQAQGAEVWLCDYQYVTGYGKHRQVHSQTLCILKSSKLAVPHCFARKQNRFLDFFGKLFGGQDINFEEDPEFSRSFVLQGESEERVRTLFSMPVRQFFLRHRGSRLVFEARGDTLMVHHGRRLKPQDVKGLLDVGFEILNLLLAR